MKQINTLKYKPITQKLIASKSDKNYTNFLIKNQHHPSKNKRILLTKKLLLLKDTYFVCLQNIICESIIARKEIVKRAIETTFNSKGKKMNQPKASYTKEKSIIIMMRNYE